MIDNFFQLLLKINCPSAEIENSDQGVTVSGEVCNNKNKKSQSRLRVSQKPWKQSFEGLPKITNFLLAAKRRLMDWTFIFMIDSKLHFNLKDLRKKYFILIHPSMTCFDRYPCTRYSLIVLQIQNSISTTLMRLSPVNNPMVPPETFP